MKKITLKKDPSPKSALKAKKKELKTAVKTEKKTAKATAKQAKIDAKLKMSPEEFKESQKNKRAKIAGIAAGTASAIGYGVVRVRNARFKRGNERLYNELGHVEYNKRHGEQTLPSRKEIRKMGKK